MDVKVTLNMPQIVQKVTNDKVGLFMAHEWKRLIDPYTPRRNGMLLQNIDLRPFTITYKEPYSHYMYMGERYVDPLYGCGGFTSDGGVTWFSRPGVEKIPSGIPLNYHRDKNPYASAQWDQAAIQAGQGEKLGRAVTKYLGGNT